MSAPEAMSIVLLLGFSRIAPLAGAVQLVVNMKPRPFDIQDRSYLFATEIIDLCKPLMPPGGVVRELARQLLRSGTSIGANVEEADVGQSTPDFISKIAIARKEARETRYWLRLLVHADARFREGATPLQDEARQLVDILTTIKLNAEQRAKKKDEPT